MPKSPILTTSKSLPFGSWRTNLAETWHDYSFWCALLVMKHYHSIYGWCYICWRLLTFTGDMTSLILSANQKSCGVASGVLRAVPASRRLFGFEHDRRCSGGKFPTLPWTTGGRRKALQEAEEKQKQTTARYCGAAELPPGPVTSRWLGKVSLRSFPWSIGEERRPDPIERRKSSLNFQRRGC